MKVFPAEIILIVCEADTVIVNCPLSIVNSDSRPTSRTKAKHRNAKMHSGVFLFLFLRNKVQRDGLYAGLKPGVCNTGGVQHLL